MSLYSQLTFIEVVLVLQFVVLVAIVVMLYFQEFHVDVHVPEQKSIDFPEFPQFNCHFKEAPPAPPAPKPEPCKFEKVDFPAFPPFPEFKPTECKFKFPEFVNEPCKFHEAREVPKVIEDAPPQVHQSIHHHKPHRHDHQITKRDGTHVGYRPHDHPDIEEALKTPGLVVRYPDGRIDEGVQ